MAYRAMAISATSAQSKRGCGESERKGEGVISNQTIPISLTRSPTAFLVITKNQEFNGFPLRGNCWCWPGRLCSGARTLRLLPYDAHNRSVRKINVIRIGWCPGGRKGVDGRTLPRALIPASERLFGSCIKVYLTRHSLYCAGLGHALGGLLRWTQTKLL